MATERKIVVLHAHINKSEKAPQRELEVARRRQAGVQRRSAEGDRDEDP